VLNAKRKILVFSAVLIAVLLVSAFGVNKLIGDAYTAQAQKLFDDARSKLEQIRGVTLPGDITLHVITKQDAVDMWGKPSGDVVLTDIYRQEKIYKGLFMMAQNDSLYQATSDWTANWGAATVGNDIYVIRENFDPFDKNAEGTFIHELTHVWQPDLGGATSFDEEKAHGALIEGDASFMGDYYVNMTKIQFSSSPQASVAVMVFLLDNPVLNVVHPMSQTLWNLNYFAYDQGKKFVDALYARDGFVTINQAYQSGYTPSSTAQVLHPDKYFANETAQPVQAPPLVDGNWTIAQTNWYQDHNTYGEYFIQSMLATWLNQTTAAQAAAGWTGDNFTYYERGNDYLFTWNIQWDNNCDASEFYVAFHNMANAAGATDQGSCNWTANGTYLTINWNQTSASTVISCSNAESAVLPSG
jgi:hypothetical protein